MKSFMIKKGLGRGLSSLIGDNKNNITQKKISISDIVRNKYQPRKHFDKEKLLELTNSIKERGIIQPIVVRQRKTSENEYEIVAGERRWLAAQNAGLNEVPVVIIDVNDEQSLEFAIVENIQRQDLNIIEEAEGYKRLMDEFGYNHEKISKFVGKSRSHIANSLRILTLPKDILDLVQNGKLSAGHARTLVGASNPTLLVKKIIENNFSVRQVENLVKKFKQNPKIQLVEKKDINILDLEKSLEEKIGLGVEIKNKKNNSGKLIFDYHDLDQLNKLISAIKNNY